MRIERYPCPAAKLFDLVDRSVQMCAGFIMHRDAAGASFGELFNVPVGVFDHQVDINRLLRVFFHHIKQRKPK